MPVKRLTNESIRSIKPVTGKRLEVLDDKTPGLVLRITETGRFSWSFVYRRRSDHKKRRLTLGPYPFVSLAEARSRSHAAIAAVSRGEDPAGDRRRRSAALTFEQLFETYLTRHVRRNLRSAGQIEARVRLHVLPKWAKRAADEIEKRDVLDLLDGLADRGFGPLANRIQQIISAMFAWAVSEDRLSRNPAVGIKKRWEEAARERFLSDAELRTLLISLDAGVMPARGANILRLCLYTGQRVGEVAGISIDEIDLDRRRWVLPAARSKNKKSHVIPLVGAALDLVARLVKEAAEAKRHHLFVTSAGAVLKATNAGNFLDNAREEIGLPHFTAHDLRRTVATHLARMGIDRMTIGATLNHIGTTKGSITGSVYDKHDRTEDIRRALTGWDAELNRIRSDQPQDNVHYFRAIS